MGKRSLVDAIYKVPESLLNRVFGNFSDIPVPATEEDAIIAIGQLSANLNNLLLKPLSGLDIVELLLRVGQKNSAAISAMLSGLEVLAGADGGGKLTIISPIDGGVFPNYVAFTCSGQGIESVEVTAGGESIAMTADGDTWSGYPSAPFTSGKHSATFAATFGDGSTAEATVNFETTANMELVMTFPENETTYAPEDMTYVQVELSADTDADSVEVTVFGEVIQLVKEAGNTFKANIPLAVEIIKNDFKGLQTMAIAVKKGATAAINEVVNFIIGDD